MLRARTTGVSYDVHDKKSYEPPKRPVKPDPAASRNLHRDLPPSRRRQVRRKKPLFFPMQPDGICRSVAPGRRNDPAAAHPAGLKSNPPSKTIWERQT